MKNSDAFVARTLLPSSFDWRLILLAALSAAMSTISAIVLVTTISLTSDILRFVKPSITDDKMLLLTRAVGLAILAISAYATQNVPQQIVPLVSLSMGVIAACVFVPLVFGLYWKGGNGAGRGKPGGLLCLHRRLELLRNSQDDPIGIHWPSLRSFSIYCGKPSDWFLLCPK